MSLPDAVAAVLWFGLTLYVIFGGADFGAGFWALLSGRSERGGRVRRLIDSSLEPVWEANHVWLIFVLVVLWTGFSEAFAAVMSTLMVPLSLIALGIVLRGSGFAFRHVVRGAWPSAAADRFFGIASLLTPFFMGTVAGAIAGGRVPPGNAEGDPISSWLNPLSLIVGALFVAINAYLSAAFLLRDARSRDDELEAYFARRALIAGAACGLLAITTLPVLSSDGSYVYDRLTAEALPLLALSIMCEAGFLVVLQRGGRKGLRPLAIGAVAALVWGWGVAQYPYLLPETLTIDQSAAPDATLISILVVFGVAAIVVLPALGLLFTLTQRDVLQAEHDSSMT